MSTNTAQQRVWRELATLHPDELRPVIWAIGHYFCVLAGFFVLRPLRETFGLAGGVSELSWLFMGTLAVTLIANPVFGALVSRYPRRVFIPVTYLAFAFTLLGFWALATFAPERVALRSGQAFYIWLSVFNVFCVMVFWAYMADGFHPEQTRRLYGILAVGGTLGALAGAALAASLAPAFDQAPQHLILVAIALLLGAIGCALRLGMHFKRMHPSQPRPAEGPPPPVSHRPTNAAPHHTHDHPGEQPVAGRAFDGLLEVARSPYLVAICVFILVMTILATFLYFTQARIVDEQIPDPAGRTAFFATVDFWAQAATLAAQLLLTGYVMRYLSVGLALSILPVIMAAAFLALAFAPSLGMLAAVQVASRAGKYAFARPARETLFAVLSRSEKYKAKSVIDTFIYRTGDVCGALTEGVIRAAALGFAGICFVAAPLIALWIAVSLWLGAARRRYESRPSPAPPPTRAAPIAINPAPRSPV